MSQESVTVLVPINGGHFAQEQSLSHLSRTLSEPRLYFGKDAVDGSESTDLNFHSVFATEGLFSRSSNNNNGSSSGANALPKVPSGRTLSTFLPKIGSFRLASLESSSSSILIGDAVKKTQPSYVRSGLSSFFTDDLTSFEGAPTASQQRPAPLNGSEFFTERSSDKAAGKQHAKQTSNCLYPDGLFTGSMGKLDWALQPQVSLGQRTFLAGAQSNKSNALPATKVTARRPLTVDTEKTKFEGGEFFRSIQSLIMQDGTTVPPTPPFSSKSSGSSRSSSSSVAMTSQNAAAVATVSAAAAYLKTPLSAAFINAAAAPVTFNGIASQPPYCTANGYHQLAGPLQWTLKSEPKMLASAPPVMQQLVAPRKPSLVGVKANNKAMSIAPMFCLAGCGKKLDEPKGRGRPSSGKCTTCRKRDNKRQWRKSKRTMQLQQNAFNALIAESTTKTLSTLTNIPNSSPLLLPANLETQFSEFVFPEN